MEILLAKRWHHLAADEVTELMGSSQEKGLNSFEVEQRQKRFGPNVLTPQRGKSPLVRFLLQFHHPLLYILMAAAVIAAVSKEVVDAAVIFGVVLINAIIGYVQEAKAEKALEALARTMTTSATVIRAGQKQQIDATGLVPGDIVLLQAGDKVPADLRLARSRDLQIDESALTGESMPVEKQAECQLDIETLLADRHNMAYTSTLVTYGQSQGVVVATGDHTEVGRISQLIATAQEMQTPLTRKIAHFSNILLYLILALAAVTFLVGVWRGESALNMLLAAVALAVGAIPEGLPAAITVVLAIGVSRMARRRAIIRKLPSVETLGGTTVICSDKTGTLTQNQMTVQQIFADGITYDVTGTGYAPSGQILNQNGQKIDGSSWALRETLVAGYLCNDSRIIEQEEQWTVQGDPTEGALLAVAHKDGFDVDRLDEQLPRLDTIPFEAEHRYMATLHDIGEGQPRPVYVKGGVEAVLAKCDAALNATGDTMPLDVDGVHRAMEALAARGLRVLALARGELPPSTTDLNHVNVASGLTFLGLQGIIDPPREEAVAAVRVCQRAGIQVKMITGDHALTARAIAQQIGLDGATANEQGLPAVLTGQQLAELSDEELVDAAETTAVFARVTPEQKLRLVQALQTRGHVVAMTGDGVNDAPALKQANIGVAMGITGTDVSKEAAAMILTDDNFASIEAAVEEGRGLFDNLTKIIAWTLPTNLGEGLIILAAVFTGVALPILPVQILWINMVTVGVLGLVLAVEPREPDIMSRLPRDPQTPILTGVLIGRIFLVAAFILMGAFGLFIWMKENGAGVVEARTVAVNAVVMVEIFYLFNCRSFTHSMFRIGLFSNRWLFGGVIVMIILQLLFTYLPVMNQLFHTTPISLEAWGFVVGVGVVTYLVVEIEKWIWRRMSAGIPDDVQGSSVVTRGTNLRQKNKTSI
ncbi:MAG: cation-transporting P-type ATPase [Anaerolineae bacterium]|nr:cation-transporting P-type ATPase [Anaerolineae bacterium]